MGPYNIKTWSLRILERRSNVVQASKVSGWVKRELTKIL